MLLKKRPNKNGPHHNLLEAAVPADFSIEKTPTYRIHGLKSKTQKSSSVEAEKTGQGKGEGGNVSNHQKGGNQSQYKRKGGPRDSFHGYVGQVCRYI
jgi:hypothetical protein